MRPIKCLAAKKMDTRVASDAINQGFTKILVRTVDTDLVRFVCINWNEILTSRALKSVLSWWQTPLFASPRDEPEHRARDVSSTTILPCFSRASCFAGHGKKIAWTTWHLFKAVTNVFLPLIIIIIIDI